jgi:HlyD family secretion protein
MDTQSTNLDEFLGTRPPSLWQRYRKWVFIGVGVLLVLWIGLRIFSGPTPTQYVMQKVDRGDLQVSVSATGKLAPTNQVTVGSELSGLVEKVLVDVNDRVTVGQPLAILDTSRLDDAIRQSEAALNANKAQVAQAQATLQQDQAQLARLEEVSKLSGGKVPSKTEMDTGKAAVARDVANVRAAQANVVSADASNSSNVTQRYKAVIRSSVNGVVLARQIEPGQTVAASFSTPTLFVIAQDLSQMKLQVAIDEADVGEVTEGQQASFTVDAFPGRSFPATITRVDLGSNLSAQAASSTTTTTSTSQVVSYAATLSVANPDLKLRPGMTATADIHVESRRGVLLVPNAALRFDPATAGKAGQQGAQVQLGGPGGQARAPGQAQEKKIGAGSRQTLYVLGADHKPKAIVVTIGATDGSRTEVTSTELKPGMEVLVGVKAQGKK